MHYTTEEYGMEKCILTTWMKYLNYFFKNKKIKTPPDAKLAFCLSAVVQGLLFAVHDIDFYFYFFLAMSLLTACCDGRQCRAVFRSMICWTACWTPINSYWLSEVLFSDLVILTVRHFLMSHSHSRSFSSPRNTPVTTQTHTHTHTCSHTHFLSRLNRSLEVPGAVWLSHHVSWQRWKGLLCDAALGSCCLRQRCIWIDTHTSAGADTINLVSRRQLL